ncbi:hypothetical protein CDD82_2428 [Ophiocordyceps australis]|uniref:G-protein coupled receptors family 1 profile domain-containing protein n=1 Tax=Ophiocordyceps australis TaxID=1399860 RepID=A0A2C5XUL0_9HYPO|nr:hypothetical protein CDD82_2428 [Ophiocordyceps australis]
MDSMNNRTQVLRMQKAATAMLFMTAIAALVVLFLTLCLVRRLKDPIRSWIPLYKIAFGLYIINLWSYSIVWLLDSIPSDKIAILEAGSHLASISDLFGHFTDILSLLALLELSYCIKLLHFGEIFVASKILRIGSLVFTIVLGIFYVVFFGLCEWDLVKFYSQAFPDNSSGILSPEQYNVLDLTGCVIMYLLSLFVLVRSTDVMVRLWGQKEKKAAMYLVVCCVLLSLRRMYLVIVTATHLAFLYTNGSELIASILNIVSVVFAAWPLFILFAILFRLGYEKKYGLYKTVDENLEDQILAQQALWDHAPSP